MVIHVRGIPVLILILVALAMVGAPPAVHADHVRVESELFVAGSLTGGTGVASRCTVPVHVGDVCFDVLPGETSADVVVEDVLGNGVAALARLYDEDFAFVAWSGSFCGFMDNLGVAGATYMVVQPLDPVNAALACGDEDVQPASAGKVTAGFH